MRKTADKGFTLIELVVVIVIAGIIAAIGGGLIVKPVTGYLDLSRRTRLVDQAEMALRRMQRDVRQALPNSVRITSAGADQFLEILHTDEGGRYRAKLDGAGAGDILNFSVIDSTGSFDVLGNLRSAPSENDELVVYNVSASAATGNAYQSGADNVATVAAGSTISKVNITQATAFINSSPYQRFFVVDGPVSYACEGLPNGVLNRYSGYTKNGTQPTSFSVTPALVTRNVSSCQFNYAAGVGWRAGLITLKIGLTEAEETITLLHQIHVVNAP